MQPEGLRIVTVRKMAAQPLDISALDAVTGGTAGLSIVDPNFNHSGTVPGGEGRDTIGGFGGNDLLQGYGGNDLLSGDDGHDVVDGGAGDDQLRGGWGHDTLVGGAGNDMMQASSDNDLVQGGDGHDTLLAGSGADSLEGGSGNDLLAADGHEGDVISGGSGEDHIQVSVPQNPVSLASLARIDGGEGRDTLTLDSGGRGAEVQNALLAQLLSAKIPFTVGGDGIITLTLAPGQSVGGPAFGFTATNIERIVVR
jgi:Ca2+-binding RTX toxin-like protein